MAEKTKVGRQSLKPYPDYPLTAHPTGQWCKKIRGKLYYFGPVKDPDKALQEYLKDRDNLQAGLPRVSDPDALTVVVLCNLYLDAQKMKVKSSELSQRTFDDYFKICESGATILGKHTLVTALKPDDWTRLRDKWAETRKLVTLKADLQKFKSVFNYAFDKDLIDKPFKWKVLLKSPSKKALRVERNKRPSQMMTAADLRTILLAGTLHMRGMVLLGLNCAFGATDISALPITALDLDGGWIDFPRPKTGIPRRCPLWPETVAALRAVLAQPRTVKDPAADGCVFVTKYGSVYVGRSPSGTQIDSVGLTFGKLLTKLKLKRKGVNFYALRHIFETIAGETEMQIPVDFIMGHAPDTEDMSAIYRLQIADPRLMKVTDHVRTWLWPEGSEEAWLQATPQDL